MKEEFYDQSVVVGSLPHPISMFLLGMFTILILVILYDHLRIRKEFKCVISDFEKLMDDTKKSNTVIEERMKELSKKIDSRVDKALLEVRSTKK